MKRFIDVVISGIILLLCTPILFAVAIAIFSKMGNPIFFTQVRPGMNGKPFKMVKFRTMSNAVGSSGEPLADKLRLTKLGKFLRATSLDELPELWNVLTGEMSLVGPRPLLMEYLPLYTAKQARRHEVRPGITGWAQINGRNALSWEEKFELDVWYVQNRSNIVDLKVLLKTAILVLAQTGINSDGHSTMPKFEGKKGPKA
jgi:lipopolysaccharide/colanic/teichoic acid biosynthesis glycosyltransferase